MELMDGRYASSTLSLHAIIHSFFVSVILKEDWLAVGPWFVLWLFTVTGLIYRSCYGIEIDWEFEDQTFAPSRTRSTAESQPSIGT